MSDLPETSWQKCVKALEKAGFLIVRQSGHIVMRRDSPPPARTVPIPRHKVIKKGTLRGIIRQAGLTVDEFKALLS